MIGPFLITLNGIELTDDHQLSLTHLSLSLACSFTRSVAAYLTSASDQSDRAALLTLSENTPIRTLIISLLLRAGGRSF